MKKFLTARWRDLIMANYEVDPALLEDFVPPGTRLDLHEERCFVSLVAFMFLDTRVRGFLIPFHINFEEVNLRFYVRRETADETRRGVTFIKEIVPRTAIAVVARLFYGEPYEAWQMSHRKSEDGSELSYAWWRGGSKNKVTAGLGASTGVPADGSHEEFITEHYWGYTKRGATRTDEYRVEHPKWEIFSVGDFEIEVDFGRLYGERFAHLTGTRPFSIFVAAGSEVAVYKGQTI